MLLSRVPRDRCSPANQRTAPDLCDGTHNDAPSAVQGRALMARKITLRQAGIGVADHDR
jgi:hypothetical protein